jgi:uncharacterized membrane protein
VNQKLTLGERFGSLFIGAIIGALYGFIIAILYSQFSHHTINKDFISFSAFLFGSISFFIGGMFIVDTLLTILQFIWGMIFGYFDFSVKQKDLPTDSFLQNIFILGLGTGMLLGFIEYWSDIIK